MVTHASQWNPLWRLGPQQQSDGMDMTRKDLRPRNLHAAAPFVKTIRINRPSTSSGTQGRSEPMTTKQVIKPVVPASATARGRSGSAHSLSRLQRYISSHSPNFLSSRSPNSRVHSNPTTTQEALNRNPIPRSSDVHFPARAGVTGKWDPHHTQMAAASQTRNMHIRGNKQIGSSGVSSGSVSMTQKISVPRLQYPSDTKISIRGDASGKNEWLRNMITG